MRKTEKKSENKENKSIVDYILKIRPDFYDPIPVQDPQTGQWSDGVARNPLRLVPLAAIKICQEWMEKTEKCPCCGASFPEGYFDEENLYTIDDIRKESDVK